MAVKSCHAGSLRVPVQRKSAQGESVPKVRLRSVTDGKQVNIPVLNDMGDGMTKEARLARCWKSWFKRVGRMFREIRTFEILRRENEDLEMDKK
jgi:hypothetical protein